MERLILAALSMVVIAILFWLLTDEDGI